ncbi:protein scabrous-like [Stegodyphus dumicola]|uniref:protein scabrous-like n=1 Tax=Stegodyphus dumicola TaxID=202533 RepID=UPI0015B05A72|nr:protein scabrous-like [Stegodyphus dumicola]
MFQSYNFFCKMKNCIIYHSTMRWILVTVMAFILTSVSSENSESLSVEDIVKGLQTELKELQKVRQQDSETIRRLEEKVQHYAPTSSPNEDSASEFVRLTEAFSGMAGKEAWRNVKAMNHDATQVQGRDSKEMTSGRHLRTLLSSLLTASEAVEDHEPELRTDAMFLSQELFRLRKQVEESEARRKKEELASSGRIAVRWLQRTVENLRHEMREMASSLNMSATLAEREKTKTSLTLMRSDMVALGHRMDSVRVDRERNAALIQQLRQDMDELRTRLQESAAGQQRILVEMDALKEEFKEQILLSQKRSLEIANHRDSSRENRTDENHHPRLRHGHWKAEVDHLQDIIDNLENRQIDLLEQVQDIKQNQASFILKFNSLEEICLRFANNCDPLLSEQRKTSQRLEILEGIVNKTESQTMDIQSRVNNITSSGIKKLHGSTVQLFKALEHLESNYDKTTADIRREMSKLDYNLSQTQSDLEELRDRQIVSEQTMSNMKNDISSVETDSKRNHFRILLVQNAVLNRTLVGNQNSNMMAMQDIRISSLESKIKSLSNSVDAGRTELESLHRQVMEKADDRELSRWERTQRKVRETILELKEDLPKMKRQQEKIAEELELFAQELPQDCSGNSTLEHILENKSGTYLIRPPAELSHESPVKVYCDMETSDGQWTVIQRRMKGDQNFNKDWSFYKKGFGDVSGGDFWMGNDLLHDLTSSEDYALRIDIWDSAGQYKYAEYSTFRVLHESDSYRLVIAGYRGNASDAMTYHNGMAFSTPDRDNDASEATHCADFYNSGWWYNHCQYVNINGRYNTGITWYDIDAHEWSELMRVEMKIKPRKLVYI